MTTFFKEFPFRHFAHWRSHVHVLYTPMAVVRQHWCNNFISSRALILMTFPHGGWSCDVRYNLCGNITTFWAKQPKPTHNDNAGINMYSIVAACGVVETNSMKMTKKKYAVSLHVISDVYHKNEIVIVRVGKRPWLKSKQCNMMLGQESD